MAEQSSIRIRPYILAGGRSSRMGRDKAMLSLAGRTLLGRTVDTLRAVRMLQDDAGDVVVTIVGERAELEGADRVIVDRYPGCGPLGGMESALRDLEQIENAGNPAADWAFFLPVDMPFLPSGLIDALLRKWVAAVNEGARVCYVVVDGTAQPLVSLLHREVYSFVLAALTSARFKVTPVLQSACDDLASHRHVGIGCDKSALTQTFFSKDGVASDVVEWTPTKAEEAAKPHWFSNLNREEDINAAETFLAGLGSNE